MTYNSGDISNYNEDDVDFSLVAGKVYINERDNIILGDVNGDGNISLVDTVIIQRMILEVVLPTDKQLLAGDINGNGNITLTDVTILMRYILGKSTNYAIGNAIS